LNEDRLIDELRERLRGVDGSRLLLGIGDDAAAWQPSRSNRSVITTDALVENVHFRRDAMTPQAIGHRALAANLSDIAAMGARPVLATIALGIPADVDAQWVAACYEGIAALATSTRCAIAGGDITRAAELVFAITVVGEVRPSNLKTRAGARRGDIVAVTGPLGASRAGLRIALDRPDLAAHGAACREALRAFSMPVPRLREGKWLGGSRHVRALMDTSDGLSTDLARLCAASGVGARIDDVPIAPAAAEVAALTGDDAAAWALDGGEDFELLAAIDRRAFPHLAVRFRAHTGRELIAVGEIVGGEGVRRADGALVPARGWDHLGA
jgi:thiamine-monophosphate kinase